MRASYWSFHFQMRSIEPLAAEVVASLLFFLKQPALDDGLRGDAGVVGAGHPERVEALHPLHADENVLQRVVQGVAEMEGAGYVRRRNDDCVDWTRISRIGVGVEVAALFPEGIPFGLGCGVVVLRG